VIDATRFAHSYNAFWNSYAPICEHYVRQLNLHELDRVEPPMIESEVENSSLIAELAFAMFERGITKSNETDQELFNKIQSKIRLLPGGNSRPSAMLSVDEINEARELSRRMNSFFSHRRKAIIFRPRLNGCGIIDQSEADVISGTALFEIKSVRRNARGGDIRQLLTYAALNFASQQFDFQSLGIFNPRTGVKYERSVDEVCWEISGKYSSEFLEDLLRAISDGGISR